MESSVEDPQYMEIEITCDPAILLLGVYPTEFQSAACRCATCTSIFTTALLTVAKVGKQTRSPPSGLNKQTSAYTVKFYRDVKN